jgi:hypothetical protein
MKSSIVKVITGALLVGTATLAAAQSPTRAQTFASQFAQMQNLSATGTYTFKSPPVLSAQAEDPVGRESFGRKFADLQAQSSNSSQFEPAPILSARAADPVGHESFADTFDRMQAASSTSGEFKQLGDGGETAYAKADSTSDTVKPTLAQRMARLMHRPSAYPAQSVN